jgi:hypothetical protein
MFNTQITIKPVITQTNNITIMSIRGVSAIPDSQTEKREKSRVPECRAPNQRIQRLIFWREIN